jgi:CheY-like chemotaxis protein
MTSGQQLNYSSDAGMEPRALVVDDEQPVLRLVKTVLDLRGYKVTLTSTVAAALKASAEEKFDVILADVNMPGMSGFDLAKCLRQAGVRTPLVFMTGGLTEIPAEMRSTLLLQKPFTARQLMTAIEKARSESGEV